MQVRTAFCLGTIACAAACSRTGLELDGEPVLSIDAAPSFDAMPEVARPALPEAAPPQVRPLTDNIDLLFMIDNSGSMGDKQVILAKAIPDLVDRLTNPLCVNAAGSPAASQPSDRTGACPDGTRREFNAIQDMHIGIVSSSLGGHGSDSCASGGGMGSSSTTNDRGHLVSRGRSPATYQSEGFLAWDPAHTKVPPGEADPAALRDHLRDLVQGVGESGCEFEASLEGWYRFLIQPDPPARILRQDCVPGSGDRGCSTQDGLDTDLLRQRADFLRPDSLVAVIMLTDEDDCSAIEGGTSFTLFDNGPVARGTSICDSNPDDRCCGSCAGPAAAGCPDPTNDPSCATGTSPSNDNRLLRCFDQKRRFGVDALYPVTRYVNGLTGAQVPDREGTLVPNPLFLGAGKNGPRDPSLVFLAGIVGVPWQDVAVDPRDDTRLEYQSAKQMQDRGTWDILLGHPDRNPLPGDPLMIPSVAERTGTNPVTGDELAPSTAKGPMANPINGREMALSLQGLELQYACVFELESPRACGGGGAGFCDCDNSFPPGNSKPICQAPDGTYGSIQYRGKAFPGTRQLQVLEGIGDNGIVASICARNVKEPARSDFGYRPALRAVLDRLREGLE